MVTTVRTTLELPVSVVEELRRRAAAENRTVNDIAAEAARIGLHG